MRLIALSVVAIVPTFFAAIALADAPLRLNEIRLEQPGADFDEYIELAGLAGESLAGVSMIVIGDDDFALPGTQSGSIEMVVSLTGYNIAKSGFFVVGEPTLSLATPNLAISLNLEGNDNVTILIVRDFTGFDGQDLDTNDDGTLDVTPWASVISSLAIVANASPDGLTNDYFYSTTTVGPEAGLAPSAAWLCANTPLWIAGSVDPFAGIDSPGAANQNCAIESILALSEVRIDETSTDNSEYFEIKALPGTSLADLTYIVLGDFGAASPSGCIEAIVPLGAVSVPGSGYFVVAEPTFALGIANLVIPGANGLNFENGENVTHLLVRNFTGLINADLDTNDDGVLDSTPWSEIVDSVAFCLTNASAPAVGTEWWYSPNRVGPDGTFVPGHVYRCTPSNDWSIGPFAPIGGKDTPGALNAACTTCGNGALNCHAVHATPGCVDTVCCNSVCVIDPTCCSTDWDQLCVDTARTSCLASGTAPVLAFNELRIDEPGNIDPNEYIEITGAPGTMLNGVSIIAVGDGIDLDGVFEMVVSLNGVMMPKDGILLIAESTFTLGTADVTRSLNMENGDSVTYFLVYNFLGLLNSDGDLDNNCAMDGTPWDSIIDSVSVNANDGRCMYSATTVGPDYGGAVSHALKCLDGSWGFGHFDPSDVTGFGTPGTANIACPPPYACGDAKGPSCYTVHAAPGCNEQSCCSAICIVDLTCCEVTWDQSCADAATLQCFIPATSPDVAISELRIDQPSFDINEYFELYGEAGTLLNGLTYIVIGDGNVTQGSGVIEFAQNLNGKVIPASGFFLAARTTFTLNGAVPNLLLPTTPEFENSDNVTHMLVFGFTGAIGLDVDTNDDGIIDVTPWASVNQSVALIESAAVPPVGTEYAYGKTRVGPDPTNFVPSQIAFCPSTGVWTIGVFDPTTAPTGDTPGAANGGCEYSAPCLGDFDLDGQISAADLSTLLGSWGEVGGDLDGDGTTNAADLSTLLGSWGPCP